MTSAKYCILLEFFIIFGTKSKYWQYACYLLQSFIISSFSLVDALLKHSYLCCLLCLFPLTGWTDHLPMPHVQLIWVGHDVDPAEALDKFKQADGLVSFEQFSDSSKHLYELHLNVTEAKTNPGSYWAKISFTNHIQEPCICFGFRSKDSINRFSQVTVYQLLDNRIDEGNPPLRTGGEVNKYDKSLWYSKTCVLLEELSHVEVDSLTLLVNLFRFRNYEDNIVLFFTKPEHEVNHRDVHISTYLPRYTFIISFCSVLFFSSLYFLIQYFQSRKILSPRRNAYLWYCLFLLLICVYHWEHLDWGSHIYGWMSHFLAWHYYYEVPLAAGIYVAYISFFQNFFQIQGKLAAIILTRSKQFVLSFPFIDVVLREVWSVNTAMDGYNVYRIVFYFIIIFLFIYIYPRSQNQESEEEKKEKHLKKLVFWGCSSLLLGSIMTIAFHIPAIREMENQWGVWLSQHSLDFTRMGILIENLFFIAAFAYKQRIEIEEQEQLKQEKKDAMRMLGDIRYQLTRSRVAQHSLTKIIDIIEKDEHRKKDLIHKVHGFVRKQYENSLEERITLAEELQQIETYLELQQLRIPDLKYAFQTISHREGEDFDPSFFNIPPSFLFPYIENAVDHGLFPKSEGEKLIKIRI